MSNPPYFLHFLMPCLLSEVINSQDVQKRFWVNCCSSFFPDKNRYLKISSKIMPVTRCSHLKILVLYFLLLLHMGIAVIMCYVHRIMEVTKPFIVLGSTQGFSLTLKNKNQDSYTHSSFLSLICSITTVICKSKPLELCCVLDGQH